MSAANQVTIILEDGRIIKEEAKRLEKKTVLQILHKYKREDNIILTLRTSTLINILKPNEIPLDKYPKLIVRETKGDKFSIPKMSLFCLKKEDGRGTFQNFMIFQPIDESEKNIKFPPFVYGFTESDQTMLIKNIYDEIVAKFNFKIENPKIFLDDVEVENCIIENFVKYVQSLKNLKKIWFKFSITEEGKEMIKKRKAHVKKMVDSEERFCRGIIRFLNQVENEHIFSELDFNTIFGAIPGIANVCTQLSTDLDGNYSYDSHLGNIFHKSIHDLRKKFIEFFENYETRMDLVSETLKGYKNNALLESIIYQIFEEDAQDFDLISIIPIKMLSIYKNHLTEIIKLTPKSHPEFHLLQKSENKLDIMMNIIIPSEQFQKLSENIF